MKCKDYNSLVSSTWKYLHKWLSSLLKIQSLTISMHQLLIQIDIVQFNFSSHQNPCKSGKNQKFVYKSFSLTSYKVQILVILSLHYEIFILKFLGDFREKVLILI